ncbi:MAG: Fic family protein [Bacteroidales bacterium]
MNYVSELTERQELQKQSLYSEILQYLMIEAQSRQELSNALGQKKVSGQLNKVIQKLLEQRLKEQTIPDIPNHPSQKFRLTKLGVMFVELLKSNERCKIILCT